MADMEETSIYTSNHFEHVLGWWRFIDDVFLIWTNGVNELEQFHLYLNSIDPDVQFTMSWCPHCLQFLDTKVFLTGNQLSTGLHKKGTHS